MTTTETNLRLREMPATGPDYCDPDTGRPLCLDKPGVGSLRSIFARHGHPISDVTLAWFLGSPSMLQFSEIWQDMSRPAHCRGIRGATILDTIPVAIWTVCDEMPDALVYEVAAWLRVVARKVERAHGPQWEFSPADSPAPNR